MLRVALFHLHVLIHPVKPRCLQYGPVLFCTDRFCLGTKELVSGHEIIIRQNSCSILTRLENVQWFHAYTGGSWQVSEPNGPC